MKKRVLAGIRATGRLHLGNYFGAVKGMLELQHDDQYETLYMVADVHTLTTPYNVEELRRNRREVMIDYLAAGLDPERSILFQQAAVNQHTELAFYFASVTTIAKMQHLPTFKEKVKQHPDHVSLALLNYPMLMAADILVYKAHLVPAGIDQEPHLEVAREVARRMNSQYGLDFPEPKRFETAGSYVPSLSGEGKMSKSVEGSFINLVDDLATISKKIAKIPTDGGQGNLEQVPAGVRSLFQLVTLFMGESYRKELEQQYQTTGLRYGEVKKELAEAIFKELEPLQKRRAELELDTKYVDEVIAIGAQKAQAIAAITAQEVREKMGLG